MLDRYDVLVIGAGPAGASTAILLAREGLKVALLDQAHFPRDKVCGDFISPGADEILADLGVLSKVESSSLRLKGVAISSYGKREICIDYPPDPKSSQERSSLSIARYQFDRFLVEELHPLGVEWLPGHRVEDLLIEAGRVTGLLIKNPSGSRFQLRASWVVDAGGRQSVSIRRLRLKRSRPGPQKIALAAHWEGVSFPKPYCYMHVSSPGYTGMAPVGHDTVNVVLVVDAECTRGRDPQEYYLNTVMSNPFRRSMLKEGQLSEKVRAVGSLAYDVAPVPVAGLMLVGDAMGFIDPFTGEGIYLSLRSAQLAAETIRQSNQAGDFTRNAVWAYEQRRNREFHHKFALSRFLQKLLYRPFWCRRVVAALGRNPQLAQTLVGVIGDYIPAKKVINWRFFKDLLWEIAAGSVRNGKFSYSEPPESVPLNPPSDKSDPSLTP